MTKAIAICSLTLRICTDNLGPWVGVGGGGVSEAWGAVTHATGWVGLMAIACGLGQNLLRELIGHRFEVVVGPLKEAHPHGQRPEF